MAFTFYKGSDRGFILEWKQGGTPMNITGAVITVNFKNNPTDTASIETKDTATGGVTLTTPASGIATVNMDKSDFDTINEETELQAGVTMVLAGRTYKQPFSINVVPVA